MDKLISDLRKAMKMAFYKYFCTHDWQEWDRSTLYGNGRKDGNLPTEIKVHFKCNKCGKFKEIRL